MIHIIHGRVLPEAIVAAIALPIAAVIIGGLDPPPASAEASLDIAASSLTPTSTALVRLTDSTPRAAWPWRVMLPIIVADFAQSPSEEPTPTLTIVPPAATPAPPPALSVASILGVTLRGEWADPAVPALLRNAGVRWVRTSVSWASIQPSPSVFDWVAFDDHIRRLDAMGVVPVVYVSGNPDWAASSRCGPIDRVPLSVFARFVSALAGRYNGSTVVDGQVMPAVVYWQFYNEPDNNWTSGIASGYDGCWGRAGARYAEMLRQAWAAVHGANPQAKVVFGGLSAEGVTCPSTWECAGQPVFNFNINGSDFLDDVLAYVRSNPGSPYFDVFDIHYYPAFHTQWDPYGGGLIGKVAYYRQRLARWGLQRPMMSTEVGRRSDAAQLIDGIPGSDEEQSRYVIRLMTRARQAGLICVMWFSLADIVDASGTSGWGLLTKDLAPKPSYTAYATLYWQLAGMLFAGPATFATNGSALEGYDFTSQNRETTVLWARSNPTTASFEGSQLTVVTSQGQPTAVQDGGSGDVDGHADGEVTIGVTRIPVFVRRPE